MTAPLVSFVMPTRDRAAALARAIDGIAAAARADGAPSAELIVVDNGSHDATPHLLAGRARTLPLPLHVRHHAPPGAAGARNAGIAAAGGRIIAFTDDDCVVAPDYLLAVARALPAGAARIVGGRVLPGDARDLPIALKTGERPLRYDRRDKPGGFLLSANLAAPRATLDRIGPFDERFGAGARFRAAEDSDLLLRAAQAGVAVDYDPALVVRHHHGRRTQAAARALYRDYWYGDGALYAKHLRRHPAVLRYVARTLFDALRELTGGRPPDPVLGATFVTRAGDMLRGMRGYAREARR